MSVCMYICTENLPPISQEDEPPIQLQNGFVKTSHHIPQLTKPQQSRQQGYQSPSYNSPHRSTSRRKRRPTPAAWLGAACLRSTSEKKKQKVVSLSFVSECKKSRVQETGIEAFRNLIRGWGVRISHLLSFWSGNPAPLRS